MLPIGVNMTQLFPRLINLCQDLDSVLNVINRLINRYNINNERTASLLNYKVLYDIA